MREILLIFLALVAAGCNYPVTTPLPSPVLVAATATSIPTQPATATAGTSEPYAGLSIAALAARSYGGGNLVDLGLLGQAGTFNRYLISYPSDGLTINGFIDIPAALGPHPVVLVLHGYVDPEGYQVENYTAGYAAAFANAGYIAIHPNYRNYPPSDIGPNEFRVGFAIDILNLIAIVNSQAGQAGLLGSADPEAVFLWGHSMGGGVTLRVITVGADVQGALVYGSMSGDERRNFEHIRDVLSEGERGNEELVASDEQLAQISPMFFYDRINVPVSIHHGDIDDVVPLAWSVELCETLQNLGKNVECFTYHNMPHTFYGLNDQLLVERSIEFFQRYTP
jgi:dipeptidyl aminopeptidase/acylaminoacyl peptidase